MSTKMTVALTGLATSLICAIIIIALILAHLQAIEAVWITIQYWAYAGIGLVVLFFAYRLFSKVYHVERLRYLERAQQMMQIEAKKNEHEYKMAELRLRHSTITIPYNHALAARSEDGLIQIVQGSVVAPRQLVAAAAGEMTTDEDAVTIPTAPPFREMAHLIGHEQMPLCWTASGPAYGDIDDMLSMAVTGKPGRGKTTALMYYVCMLLRNGAEVVVWDPHGVMAELAELNNRVLPNMPATARLTYYDRKEDIINSVPGLLQELEERDRLYRPPYREVKHPLLLLADELPILADFDAEIEQQYKIINKRLAKEGEDSLPVPSLLYLIRRMVLEARKWRCFFIGSGQSFDAEVLPTKVVENLSSRIVFFSSDRRARMSGLENDAIKNLLPAIRRAGSGVMIFDCSRWDGPMIGAIPMITVTDMLEYLGVTETASDYAPPSPKPTWNQTYPMPTQSIPRLQTLGGVRDIHTAQTIELGGTRSFTDAAKRAISQTSSTGPLSVDATALQLARSPMTPPPAAIIKEEEELSEDDLADTEDDPEVVLSPAEEAEWLHAALILHQRDGKMPGRVAVMMYARELALQRGDVEAARKWNKKNWARIKALAKKFGM